MQGWITIHRQIIEWEWYTDANTVRVFIHCLLRANHQEAKWRGKVIKRGTFLSSFDILASELKLSRQQIRTAINKLKSTNEVTTSSSAQSTVFKVENYDIYQPSTSGATKHQPGNNQQITNEQPTDNQRITTNNNDNNVNNEKNDNKSLVAFDNNCEAFNVFYNAGLAKKSKAAAKKSFDKLVKKEKLDPIVIAEMLRDDIQARIASKQFGIENLHPSTYLNNKRWEDGIDQPKH